MTSRGHHQQRRQVKFILVASVITLLLGLSLAPVPTGAAWLFRDFLTNTNNLTAGTVRSLSAGGKVELPEQQPQQQEKEVQAKQELQQQQDQQKKQQQAAGDAAAEVPSDFTIAGLKPSNIASLLNSVSESGFSYFNVHDQCRSRTACDVGYMLYKKLNFIHNWIIRASVRTLVDSSNIYAQSWNNGMMGRNCTISFPACHQSPLESLLNFAMLTA